MTRFRLDANVVLRFLRDDDPHQSPAARRLVEEAKGGKVTLSLSAVTVMEIFYALRASYKMPRAPAAGLLKSLLETSIFEIEHAARLAEALRLVEQLNVDLVDAYLAATAADSSEPVASFDDDFKRFPGLRLHRP